MAACFPGFLEQGSLTAGRFNAMVSPGIGDVVSKSKENLAVGEGLVSLIKKIPGGQGIKFLPNPISLSWCLSCIPNRRAFTLTLFVMGSEAWMLVPVTSFGSLLMASMWEKELPMKMFIFFGIGQNKKIDATSASLLPEWSFSVSLA